MKRSIAEQAGGQPSDGNMVKLPAGAVEWVLGKAPNRVTLRRRDGDEIVADLSARNGWAAQYWSRMQGAEHLATRENVVLFDLTGLSIVSSQYVGAGLAPARCGRPQGCAPTTEY